MPRAFAEITFTDSVKAAQALYGSREFNQRFEMSPEPRNQLNQMDTDFISARDSFYQASVSENGWPYVQHRGGPAGFLKTLDERTIAYADFSGNRQYISVGNMMANTQVCLFLMDYANRQRLKIWGRATIVHERDNPQLLSALTIEHYAARVERAIIIQVEALEWNCSKHITQRFTATEVKNIIAPLMAENEQLKARLAAYEAITPNTNGVRS